MGLLELQRDKAWSSNDSWATISKEPWVRVRV